MLKFISFLIIGIIDRRIIYFILFLATLHHTIVCVTMIPSSVQPIYVQRNFVKSPVKSYCQKSYTIFLFNQIYTCNSIRYIALEVFIHLRYSTPLLFYAHSFYSLLQHIGNLYNILRFIIWINIQQFLQSSKKK